MPYCSGRKEGEAREPSPSRGGGPPRDATFTLGCRRRLPGTGAVWLCDVEMPSHPAQPRGLRT